MSAAVGKIFPELGIKVITIINYNKLLFLYLKKDKKYLLNIVDYT